MPDVEVVNAVAGEAGWHCRGFIFCVREEDGELVDSAEGNVAAVVAAEERFALEIEKEDCGGHVEGTSMLDEPGVYDVLAWGQVGWSCL